MNKKVYPIRAFSNLYVLEGGILVNGWIDSDDLMDFLEKKYHNAEFIKKEEVYENLFKKEILYATWYIVATEEIDESVCYHILKGDISPDIKIENTMEIL